MEIPKQTPKKSRRLRWRTILLFVLALALVCFLFRATIGRAVVAGVIWRQSMLSEPKELLNKSLPNRAWDRAVFFWDLSKLRIEREKRLREFNPQLKPLIAKIVRRQANGEGMQYSMHIYREIRWRLNFTPDTAATATLIAKLKTSLSQPAMQKLATTQLPEDGSWGLGISEWYLKAKLDSDLYDHFTVTAVFNREELDETFSALARLLYRQKITVYPFHPDLKATLRQFVNEWQNPRTGCWGQWIVDRNGWVWKMDDMAMTFHVVADLRGQVDHLDRIAKRILELDGTNFPTGIRFDGSYANHLNWDVVKIFRYAWPYLDTATRQAAKKEISGMMAWCLKESYLPDGSFKVSELDETLGDAYFYGVSFLVDAGYFNPEKRFWTNQDFIDAPVVREKLENRLRSTGLNDPQLRDAYSMLISSVVPAPKQ
jgi:hypothetical protein